jgi:hypothetical protein
VEDHRAAAHGGPPAVTAPLSRDAQMLAVRQLRKGDKTRCGWTLIEVYEFPRDAWPWCLIGRGKARGRVSPRQFLRAIA